MRNTHKHAWLCRAMWCGALRLHNLMCVHFLFRNTFKLKQTIWRPVKNRIEPPNNIRMPKLSRAIVVVVVIKPSEAENPQSTQYPNKSHEQDMCRIMRKITCTCARFRTTIENTHSCNSRHAVFGFVNSQTVLVFRSLFPCAYFRWLQAPSMLPLGWIRLKCVEMCTWNIHTYDSI